MAVFVSSSAFAGLNDLIGHYNLVNSQVEGKTFCYRNIDIVQEENGLLSLYRSDTSEYGPIVSAAVNGAKRENSYSHGEALSTTKGNDSVIFKDETLSFAFDGVTSILGVPAMRTSDSFTIKLSADKKTAYAVRKTFDGPVAGLGKRAKALCEYSKAE